MKDPQNFLSVSALMIAGDIGPYSVYTNKNNKLVFYPRAPPTTPASPKQAHMRAMWAIVANDWKKQTHAARAIWEKITIKTAVRMTGYNLFMCVETSHRGRRLLPTLLRQAGILNAPNFRIRGPDGAGQYNAL